MHVQRGAPRLNAPASNWRTVTTPTRAAAASCCCDHLYSDRWTHLDYATLAIKGVAECLIRASSRSVDEEAAITIWGGSCVVTPKSSNLRILNTAAPNRAVFFRRVIQCFTIAPDCWYAGVPWKASFGLIAT
jgi:hypothetical protein